MTHREKIKYYSRKPVGIASIISLLGASGFGGYKAARNFVVEPVVNKVNDVIVNMKAGAVRENIIIEQNDRLIAYEELKLKLNFRPDDIKAAKNEMIADEFWD